MFNRIISKIGGGDIGSSAIKAIILSGSFSIFLKLFGLIKEAVLANYFGVSGQLDLYFLAMLSLLFFVSPVAGTIGTLLTQKYIETKQSSTIIAALVYRQSLFVAGFLITLFLLLFFAVHQILVLHSILPAQFDDIRLSEFFILAPIAILSVISVVNGAVFTAEKRFITFSSLPTIVPLTIIICLFLDLGGNLFFSLLLGTLIGYILEMVGGIILLSRLWSKFFESMCDKANQKFAEMKSSFLPLFSASLIMGGCVVVDQFMAVLVGEGAVSIVNFGSRLPLGLISVVGITWIVLYPIFSELVAKKEDYELRKIYLRFVGLCFIVLLPLCLAISLFSSELITLFFQRGAFGAEDTNIVSQLQIFYLLYIPFYTICMFSIRVANSYQSQKIILLGNSLTLGVNIIMNLVFIMFYGVLGIAAATLVSYCLMSVFWIAAVLMMYFPRNLSQSSFLNAVKQSVFSGINQYLKYHAILLLQFYGWLMSKTDKSVFSFLFNTQAFFLRSPARASWQNDCFAVIDTSLPSLIQKIRHQKISNEAYKWGFKARSDGIAKSYFLEKIGFSNGDTFIDCGANVGDLKLWFDINNIKIDYVGFEPSPVEFDCLKENIRTGKVFNVGLWNKDTHKDFYVSSQGADSSLVRPVWFDEVVRVKVERLEHYISSPVKCLKLEAEGGEPEVLEGLGKKLEKIEFISADLGFERGIQAESTLVPVTNYLLGRGFELVDVSHSRVCALFRNKKFKSH